MAKKQIALRITDETDRQLNQLTSWLGATKTEVLIYAVERLYQQMRQQMQSAHQTSTREDHLNGLPDPGALSNSEPLHLTSES